jgi:hypothetical protein
MLQYYGVNSSAALRPLILSAHSFPHCSYFKMCRVQFCFLRSYCYHNLCPSSVRGSFTVAKFFFMNRERARKVSANSNRTRLLLNMKHKWKPLDLDIVACREIVNINVLLLRIYPFGCSVRSWIWTYCCCEFIRLWFVGMCFQIINMNVLLLRIYPFMIRWDVLSDHKHERTVVVNLFVYMRCHIINMNTVLLRSCLFVIRLRFYSITSSYDSVPLQFVRPALNSTAIAFRLTRYHTHREGVSLVWCGSFMFGLPVLLDSPMMHFKVCWMLYP